MVRLLEELPPELQEHIAGILVDAAAPGRWAQACRASRLLLLPRLDELLEARRYARQQAVLDKLSCRPQCLRHGQRRATEMLQFMCCHAIWTASFVLAALATVLCIQLAIALAAPTCCGISLPSSIGQATASRFTVWTLMRPPGARLRRERPHLLTCSREQRKNSGGGACG